MARTRPDLASISALTRPSPRVSLASLPSASANITSFGSRNARALPSDVPVCRISRRSKTRRTISSARNISRAPIIVATSVSPSRRISKWSAPTHSKAPLVPGASPLTTASISALKSSSAGSAARPGNATTIARAIPTNPPVKCLWVLIPRSFLPPRNILKEETLRYRKRSLSRVIERDR